MPDIMDHYEAVMPAALDLLMDPSPKVRKTGCYAIDQFVEQLEDDRVVPYMEPLMSRLLTILSSSQQPGGGTDHEIVDMALSAIASAAASANEDFTPYASHVLPILRQFMNVTMVEPSPVNQGTRARWSDREGTGQGECRGDR